MGVHLFRLRLNSILHRLFYSLRGGCLDFSGRCSGHSFGLFDLLLNRLNGGIQLCGSCGGHCLVNLHRGGHIGGRHDGKAGKRTSGNKLGVTIGVGQRKVTGHRDQRMEQLESIVVIVENEFVH